MIEVEINGSKIQAQAGQKIIALADDLHIDIPRFCYHKNLSIAANCRMCLVSIEGVEKPQPACSTPLADGMKIHTENEKTKTAQKAVMEFLLINHPLDCPICDQGGECELQDVAMGYGRDVSVFNQGKRVVADKNIGALIQTDMTRCIHCTRCVRFGAEVAGVVEMGATGRGENMHIEPFLQTGIQSELSGNMIDICPVGALTSKPFRYALRSWQMDARPAIGRHDLAGANLYAQTHQNEVRRVVPRENENINETWIADRERFSYEALKSEARFLQPKIKIAGEWKNVEWQSALDFANKGLQKSIIKNRRANRLAGLISKTATLEEFYLFQKFLRTLGSENIDHRMRAARHLPSNIKIAEIDQIEHALLVGSHLRLEEPMINHRLRKATQNGATVDIINSADFDFNYPLAEKAILPPAKMPMMLAGILKILDDNAQISEANIKIQPSHKKMAHALQQKKSVIILGAHILLGDHGDEILALAQKIAEITNAKILNLSHSANANGAWLANAIPGENGWSVEDMETANPLAFCLVDIYPRFDFVRPEAMLARFADADFIISMNAFQDEDLEKYTDVMLPLASFYETAGTHVNIDGARQFFDAAVKPRGDAKPGWKILKVFADGLGLPGFDFWEAAEVSEAVGHAQKSAVKISSTADNMQNIKNPKNGKNPQNPKNAKNPQNTNIEIIWQHNAYASDAVVRHAKSLAKTEIGKTDAAMMTPKTAQMLGLAAGDDYDEVPVSITDRVAENCIFVRTRKPRPLKK